MKCPNCWYEEQDGEFLMFECCPACCASLDGTPNFKGVPVIFALPKKGSPQWYQDQAMYEITLPVNYNILTPKTRRIVREEYIRLQDGLCYHCKALLSEPPAKGIRELFANKDLFPENFFDYPIHLHHDHKTGLTIGAVHNYCNAVLWCYYGE